MSRATPALIEARINVLADQIAAEGMILRAADVRAGAVEISRQRHEIERLQGVIQQLNEGNDVLATRYCDCKAENARLRREARTLLDAAAEIEATRAERDANRDQGRALSSQNNELRTEIERLQAAAAMALDDLEQTYCHVSSVSADRIKAVTIPALRAALENKP